MDKKLAFTGFFLLCTLLSATAQQADSLRILPEPPSAGAGEPIGEVENLSLIHISEPTRPY